MGSGRIDGRPVMVAAEDFTVKAGHDQPAGELEAVPRRRARGRRPRAAGHDAGRRRVPRRRASATPRTPTDLLAQARCSGRVPLVTAVLGASAGHGALVAPMSDFSVMSRHGVDLHRRPAGRVRVDGRDDHQGGPRRPGVALASGLIHNVADDDAGRARPRAHLPPLLPVVGVVVPARRRAGGDVGPRVVPELLDIVPRNGRRVYDMRKVHRRRVRRRTRASRCSPTSAVR